MKKLFGLIAALLAIFSASVMAADYAIQTVYLNGYQISGNVVQVELGQPVTLDVAVYGNSNKDVRLRAWIGGYEYDIVEDASEMFDVENGVTEWKKLSFDVPEDMVAGKPYTLNIELFDEHNTVERQYTLYVEAKRHNIAVQDVMLTPSSSLEAGQTLFAKIRLENMGEKKEEDIRVTLSIDALGVSTRNYMDELPKYMADENSGNAPTLSLMIPENAATGDYKVKVSVSYNRGHEETVEEVFVHVDGVSAETLKNTKSMVSVESVKELSLNEESVVKIMVANLGKKTNVYSLEAAGLDNWADSSLVSSVSVAPGQTGELLVRVTPKSEGNHAFSLKVKENGSLVKEASLNAEVVAKENNQLFWIAGAVLALLVLFAIVASSMFGEKVNHKELHQEF